MGAGEIRLFRATEFEDLVSTLNTSFQREFGCVLLLDEPLPQKQAQVLDQHPGIVCLATGRGWGLNWPRYILGYVENAGDRNQLLWALESARRILDLRHERQQLEFRTQIEREKLDAILSSTLELTEEKDPYKLCDKILSNLRRQVRAEGATLYFADNDKAHLQFLHVQNEKVRVTPTGFVLPIDETSMAGACAFRRNIIHVPDVRSISPAERFKFNDSFDRKTGYTTKSVLCLPLVKSTGELVGVVQLLNSKREFTFTDEDIEIGRVLSAPIAASLETALLYQDIEKLFEGFIRASVVAIESRDPATSGHSERVALYTLSLAQKVSESSSKEFKNHHFNEKSLRELRYASLLHDFGKIGVPEPVLQKEKKLYPEELKEIQHRVKLIKVAFPQDAHQIDAFLAMVLQMNEPTVTIKETAKDIEKFLGKSFDVGGEKIVLLNEDEHQRLTLTKGSLNSHDRNLIERHVEHTYRFLAQIPWTRDLKNVAEIAYAHHEKLDGTGYPRKISADKIPVESQIMAISDIYDALTSPDRPYKKSIPVEKALEILKEDAQRGKLSQPLVGLFIDQKAYSIKNTL